MKPFPLLAAVLSLAFLAGCGSFERQWEQSVADYQAGKVRSPEGPWEGTWETTSNGHTGDLRAIVSESKKNPGNLDFRYHATWGEMFRGAFHVDYPAARSGSAWIVDGEENLGLFGKFGHKAKITPGRFDATYSNAKGEIGAFSLHRPE